MSELQMKFGQHLKHLRHQRRLTQEDMADMTGLSVDLISNIERGINAPSFKTLEKLAEALAIPVSALFIFDGEDNIS
jgi:transcriptional regulator with XRE-family HTH domain